VDAAADRTSLLRRGRTLAVVTVAWNVVEGVVAVLSGAAADSVALIGFGIDSFVETASAVAVGLRLADELRHRDPERAERVERRAARLAGALLLALAAWLLFDAGRRLLGLGAEPRRSLAGIAITSLSLLVMPVLGRAKLRTARALGSVALRADAYETITCAWLSLTTLGGLVLNALAGWWWADPVAALALVPLVVREGLEGWRGGCGDRCHGDR
jgi:divalent metal cation (Fe/Co/Zn/Cd) transporter